MNNLYINYVQLKHELVKLKLQLCNLNINLNNSINNSLYALKEY